jgi:hypothetical protein
MPRGLFGSILPHLDDPLANDSTRVTAREAVARAGVISHCEASARGAAAHPIASSIPPRKDTAARKRVLAPTLASQAVGWWTLRVEGVVIVSGGLGSATEAVVRFDDGGSIEVREFDPNCSYAGDLRDGETRTFEDACTATRRGGKVVWTEPPKGLAKAA